MKKRVYIAGPISVGDLADNIRRASEAFFKLLHAGFAPFCPHWSAYSGGPYNNPVPAILPNGTVHSDWLGADLPWVSVADVVLRIAGASKGAEMEVECADTHKIPVYYNIDELIAKESQ